MSSEKKHLINYSWNTYVEKMTELPVFYSFTAASHQSVNFHFTLVFLNECQSVLENPTALGVTFLKSAWKTLTAGECLAYVLFIYGLL